MWAGGWRFISDRAVRVRREQTAGGRGGSCQSLRSVEPSLSRSGRGWPSPRQTGSSSATSHRPRTQPPAAVRRSRQWAGLRWRTWRSLFCRGEGRREPCGRPAESCRVAWQSWGTRRDSWQGTRARTRRSGWRTLPPRTQTSVRR